MEMYLVLLAVVLSLHFLENHVTELERKETEVLFVVEAMHSQQRPEVDELVEVELEIPKKMGTEILHEAGDVDVVYPHVVVHAFRVYSGGTLAS